MTKPGFDPPPETMDHAALLGWAAGATQRILHLTRENTRLTAERDQAIAAGLFFASRAWSLTLCGSEPDPFDADRIRSDFFERAGFPDPAPDEGPCPAGTHVWVGREVGGPPDAAESHDWVCYCNVCGKEKTDDEC